LKKKTTNIGLNNNNNSNNNNSSNTNNSTNELIDRLYKAKIKIMEESKDILIKRINELYEEQLVKLKEEYSSDVNFFYFLFYFNLIYFFFKKKEKKKNNSHIYIN